MVKHQLCQRLDAKSVAPIAICSSLRVPHVPTATNVKLSLLACLLLVDDADEGKHLIGLGFLLYHAAMGLHHMPFSKVPSAGCASCAYHKGALRRAEETNTTRTPGRLPRGGFNFHGQTVYILRGSRHIRPLFLRAALARWILCRNS